MFSYPVFLLAGVFLYHFHVLSRLKECGASLWLSPLPHLTHLQLLMLAEPVLWGCFLLEISVRSWGGGGMEISLVYSWIPKSVLKATFIDSYLWPFSAGKCLCVCVCMCVCYCFVLNFFSTSLWTLEGRDQFFMFFLLPLIFMPFEKMGSHILILSYGDLQEIWKESTCNARDPRFNS